MIEPIAAVVAGPEPEIAAKNVQATMVTVASPPGADPTMPLEKSISRSVSPPFSINTPAKMNIGTAIMVNSSTAEYAVWTR